MTEVVTDRQRRLFALRMVMAAADEPGGSVWDLLEYRALDYGASAVPRLRREEVAAIRNMTVGQLLGDDPVSDLVASLPPEDTETLVRTAAEATNILMGLAPEQAEQDLSERQLRLAHELLHKIRKEQGDAVPEGD